MSQAFNNYESDFQLAYDEIQHKLDDLTSLSSDARKNAIQAIERAIDEAYEIIDQMSIEVQNIASSQRSQYNIKIRDYKSQTLKAKQTLKNSIDQFERSALFGDRDTTPSNSDDIALDQRQQLLSGQSSLDRSSQRLRDSQRLANETESVGANILNDLRGQREQIVNSRNTLSDADNYVDRSIRTLKTMARRMASNRIITMAIIAILIILILLVLISKFW